MNKEELKGKAKDLKGRAKEGAGEMTDRMAQHGSRALVLRTPTKRCGNEAYDRQNNDDHDDADPDAGFEDRADRFACRHGQRQRRDYDQSQKTRCTRIHAIPLIDLV